MFRIAPLGPGVELLALALVFELSHNSMFGLIGDKGEIKVETSENGLHSKYPLNCINSRLLSRLDFSQTFEVKVQVRALSSRTS